MNIQEIVALAMTSKFGRDTVNSLVIEGLYQYELSMTKWVALKKVGMCRDKPCLHFQLNLVEENTTKEELITLQMEYAFKIMELVVKTAELSSKETWDELAIREAEADKIQSEKILKVIGELIELWDHVDCLHKP